MYRTFVLYVYHIINNSQRQVLFRTFVLNYMLLFSPNILFSTRTRRTAYGSPKDALPLGSKRNGTKLESCFAALNLAKCRQFKSEGFKHIQTVLMTTVYYPTLCIEYILNLNDTDFEQYFSNTRFIRKPYIAFKQYLSNTQLRGKLCITFMQYLSNTQPEGSIA